MAGMANFLCIVCRDCHTWITAGVAFSLLAGNQVAMLADLSLVGAFLVGLLGGVHCAGMCGGIVGVLSLGVPGREMNKAPNWYYLLAYNAGRIFSYAVAGGLLGGIAWLASNWSGLHQIQRGLQLLAALFLVALGLYLAGWWRGLLYIERLGGVLWMRLEPFGRRLLPVSDPVHAFMLGLVWGWLPCGLVYSVLVWSISTGSPFYGALLMLSFGLGTLPNLLLMGIAAERMAGRVRDKRTRQIAGMVVLSFAAYSLYQWFIR